MPKDIESLYDTGGAPQTGLSQVDPSIKSQTAAAQASKVDKTAQKIDSVFKGLSGIVLELGKLKQQNDIFNTGVFFQESAMKHFEQLKKLPPEKRLEALQHMDKNVENYSKNFEKDMLKASGNDQKLVARMQSQYVSAVAQQYLRISDKTQSEYSEITKGRIDDATKKAYRLGFDSKKGTPRNEIVSLFPVQISGASRDNALLAQKADYEINRAVLRGKLDKFLEQGDKENINRALDSPVTEHLLTEGEFNKYKAQAAKITKEDNTKYGIDLVRKAMNSPGTAFRVIGGLNEEGSLNIKVARFSKTMHNIASNIHKIDINDENINKAVNDLGLGHKESQKIYADSIRFLETIKKRFQTDRVDYNLMMGRDRGPDVLTNKEIDNVVSNIKRNFDGTLTNEDLQKNINIPGVPFELGQAALFSSNISNESKYMVAMWSLNRRGEFRGNPNMGNVEDQKKMFKRGRNIFGGWTNNEIKNMVGSANFNLSEMGRGNRHMNRVALEQKAMELAAKEQGPGVLKRLFGGDADPIELRQFAQDAVEKLPEAYKFYVDKNANAVKKANPPGVKPSPVIDLYDDGKYRYGDEEKGGGSSASFLGINYGDIRNAQNNKPVQSPQEIKENIKEDHQTMGVEVADEDLDRVCNSAENIESNVIINPVNNIPINKALADDGQVFNIMGGYPGQNMSPVEDIDGNPVSINKNDSIKNKNLLLENTKRNRHLGPFNNFPGITTNDTLSKVLKTQSFEGPPEEKTKRALQAFISNSEAGSILGAWFKDKGYSLKHMMSLGIVESDLGSADLNRPGAPAVGVFQVHKSHFKLPNNMELKDKIKFWGKQNNSVVAGTLNGIALMKEHARIIQRRLTSKSGLYAHKLRGKDGQVIKRISFVEYMRTAIGDKKLTYNDVAIMSAAHYNGGAIFNNPKAALGFMNGNLYQGDSKIEHVRENVGHMLHMMSLQGKEAPRGENGIITNTRLKDFLLYAVHLSDGSIISVNSLLGERRIKKLVDNNHHVKLRGLLGEGHVDGFGSKEYQN